MTFTGTHLEFSPAPEHDHAPSATEDENHFTDDPTDHSNH